MRYTSKTEYGLICLVNIAKKGSNAKMAIKELAELENYPYSYVEKIFQNLRSAGIVLSHQGNQGGYSLAKSAEKITLQEVIEAIEGGTFDVFCRCPVEKSEAREMICNHKEICNLRGVWFATKQLLDQLMGSITLDMIAQNKIEIKKIMPKISGLSLRQRVRTAL